MTLVAPGATATWVDHGGGRVRVLRAGPGFGASLPVLLVHGGGYDHAGLSWYRVLEPLARHRPVLAPDLPGFGGTTGVEVTGDADRLADLLVEVVSGLGHPRFAVVGISMGGDVALHLALRHPGAVAGLVLVAAGGLTERIGSPAVQRAAWVAAQLPDPVLFGLSRVAGRFADVALGRVVRDRRRVPPPVRDGFRAEARRSDGGRGYARYNQATLGPRRMRNNLLPVVHRITVRTLLLHGEDDRLVAPADSRAATDRMPQARLVTVPDCGHWLPVEAPDAFLTEVVPFLAALDQ
ncbi:pimeloyl-ACP methyl ester carboxylesterase [Friedmanniella endophytica]|uniref:Pimeloyl-ACP methyl ester carboxylesterase n=1 Tax=Microlunatus kandeliicorticis TaxID=1759536 RepID=A0A7W3ITA2_9ACTN|nr:alpha/beta hydrolase [Microlunatus kandeliicorticis]MBA8794808.1 pimeloyl-ACP methyl ester carboxylesterase [Microlunatus kandeliicorticis]